MIIYLVGNILHDKQVQALVNPVNCVGVMGKGLAKQFKQHYPQMHTQYASMCKERWIEPGYVYPFHLHTSYPSWIINFPTKRHWANLSLEEDIKAGLVSLRHCVKALHIESLAIPPLGCGLGGLRWSTVKPMIEEAFESFGRVHIKVYKPA